MKPGDVVSKENELYVITKIEYGQITEMQDIEEYVSKMIMIEIEGEYMTLKGIINMCVNNYLYDREIVEI